MKRTLLALATTVALAGTAAAQTTGSTTTTPPATTSGTGAATSSTGGARAESRLDRGDRKFVEEAAKSGMAEVALGKLATVRAQNSQVKAFGQRMLDDHGKANEELKTIAQAKGLSLPAELDRGHHRDADKLGKREGREFDREYMEHMVDEHKKDVRAFEKAAKDAKDPEIRAFAAKQLPVLKEHHEMARTLHDTVKRDRDAAANASGTGATTGTGTGR